MLAASPFHPARAGGPSRVALPQPAHDHLNWMRGLAAVAVLVGHVRGLGFVDYDALPRRSAGLSAFYLLTGLGHEAVIVFFVLSGFFIATSVLGVTDPRPFSWKRFLLNRFTRLYVVYLPALALTALWDSAGMALFGADGNAYAGVFPGAHIALNDVRRTIGVRTFLGNVAFLQDFFVLPFGSNGPSWSLSYEFWFYLVFPLLVCAVAGGAGRRPWQRVAMAAAALGVMAVGGRTFVLYFAIWLMGAVVARNWPRFAGPRAPGSVATATAAAVAAGVLFFGTLLVARVRLLGPVWRGDLALGAATAVFVAALLAAGHRAGLPKVRGLTGPETDPDLAPAPSVRSRLRRGYSRLGEALAGCSYTLYLTHYPPLLFLYVWVIGGARRVPTPAHVLAAGLVAAAVLALYAYPLSRVTEAHTDRVRKFLGRALGVERRAAAVAAPAHPPREGAPGEPVAPAGLA